MLLRAALIALIGSTAFTQTGKPSPAAGRKPQLLWQKLEQTIREGDHSLEGVLGVALMDLTTGETFFYNADEIYPTASSIKIAVLTELYRPQRRPRAGFRHYGWAHARRHSHYQP
jgi:beta-lactamase class A